MSPSKAAILFVSFVTLIVLCQSLSNKKIANSGDDNNVLVEVFSYSTCVDAQRFYQIILGTLVKQVGGIMDLKFYYILDVDPKSPIHFKSKGGQRDVIGDYYEACVADLYPSNYSYFDFIMCVNKNISNYPNNADDCADQLKMDMVQIVSCAFGTVQHGRQLLMESVNAVQQRGVTWSPTIYINKNMFCKFGSESDCQAKDVDGFRKEICDNYPSPKPPACTTQ